MSLSTDSSPTFPLLYCSSHPDGQPDNSWTEDHPTLSTAFSSSLQSLPSSNPSPVSASISLRTRQQSLFSSSSRTCLQSLQEIPPPWPRSPISSWNLGGNVTWSSDSYRTRVFNQVTAAYLPNWA